MNSIDYNLLFEDTLSTYKKLYKAYQDGYIMEDEQTFSQWVNGMGELIVEIGNIRQGISIQYFNSLAEKETMQRINEIEDELNNSK